MTNISISAVMNDEEENTPQSKDDVNLHMTSYENTFFGTATVILHWIQRLENIKNV